MTRLPPADDTPAGDGPVIDVLLADDDPVVRFGLKMMLGGAPDLRVVAEASDGAEAVELARRHRPDVVLMDIRMPGTDGLTATETLRGGSSGPQVIVFTTFDADARVLRALRAGAAGFLLKDTPPDELVVAIRHAAQGRPVLSPEVMRRLIARVADAEDDGRQQAARRRLDVLADRERTVATEIGAGRTNAEIAARHHLGLTTVKTHVSAILTKLDLTNRVQVALLVQEAGLVPPE
ncbi:response regulator transcription factor [Micromonospora robiginosa]|uniref:Response regulator transcription factor n=1 Tax=Micromonospora robiginosa TaxID=2749844 RepID=A0A7L6BEC4_9ACTN|nr:response regulator transcription factor [Micromonospora ferruginea]QLQ40284.2 response regulator transcription factor [Micromonospora ferruginea]